MGGVVMILDKIDEKRLLIALSSEDMDFLDITFNQLDWKNDYSREIIKNLLARAESEIGFSSSNKKLLIEAIPQSNGCFVIITLLSNKIKKSRKTYKIKNNSKPFTFFFKDSDSLFALVERIYNKSSSFVNSSIIELNNSYYIIFYANGSISSNMMAVISEYGELSGKDSIVAARVFEKGNVIVKNRAVEEFGKYLIT